MGSLTIRKVGAPTSSSGSNVRFNTTPHPLPRVGTDLMTHTPHFIYRDQTASHSILGALLNFESSYILVLRSVPARSTGAVHEKRN